MNEAQVQALIDCWEARAKALDELQDGSLWAAQSDLKAETLRGCIKELKELLPDQKDLWPLGRAG